MCDLCHGLPGCPVCAPEPKMRTCPSCNGDGYEYYALDILTCEAVRVSAEEYVSLPDSEHEAVSCGSHRCKWESVPCPECGGEGEVKVRRRTAEDYNYAIYL